MRILACPDSFKGTLSAPEAAEVMRASCESSLLDAECVALPLSDGGEGALECLAATGECQILEEEVTGPDGMRTNARWALTADRRGFIELAEASGLALMDGWLDPMGATSRGTGELLLAALDADCRDITLAIGGSATNDGGMGMLSALGVRFLGASGEPLEGSGADLSRVRSVDADGLDPRIRECRIRVLCDVDNPLLGPEGATRVFGPQKGAEGVALAELEAGMLIYARLCAEALGEDFSAVPGAGAAGGVGFASLAFLGAELTGGIEGILDLVGFDGLLETVDLVVTGEGHADAQTLHGKAIAGVARRCAEAGVPCVAIVGAMDASATALLDAGVTALVPTVIDADGVEGALSRARENLALACDRAFALIALGQHL